LRAAEKVKAIRAEEKIEEGYGLRLKVMGGGCSGFAYDLFFDQVQDVDQTFESQGVRMLCDQMSLMYLAGHRNRLRRKRARLGLQVHQPERQVDLRLRLVVQRLRFSSRHSTVIPSSSFMRLILVRH
jgi:iron-sulfur cluster assembly accessory protein